MSTSTTNKDQHETFVKKISQWEKMSRSNWKWEQAPSHRQKLLQVFKTNKKLSTEMMDDMKSLNGLEQGLEVMNYYIKESDKNMIRKNQDHETDDTKKDEDIRLDINQCLILKKDTQEKIKRNLQTQKESTSIKNSLSSQYASPPKASKPPILEEVPKSTRYETGITFLTDVEVVDLPIEKPKTPVQKRPNISVEKESQVPQRTRNIQTVESLLKLLPPKEETNIRRKSAGSMIVKPLSRPSTAYHDVDGPSMIDRQMEWMEKVEAKRRSAKIAKDQELVKELRPTPDIRVTQQSWEKAKKSHAKEISKENANEILKRQLEEMKEEMKNLRMEEKLLKQKCLLSAVQLEENERLVREGKSGENRLKSKGQKKKKKRKQERKEQSDESAGEEVVKGSRHIVHIENTPVRRKDNAVLRPASAGHQRPPSSSSRTSLHSSSTSLFPELESSTATLFDVLDLVLSPSPRYPSQNSGGSKSNRREAFQFVSQPASSSPDMINTKVLDNKVEEDTVSRDTSDPFLYAQIHPHNRHDEDTCDDSTMISNLTDRTFDLKHQNDLPHKDIDLHSIQRSDITSSIKSITPPPTHSNRFFDASSTSDKGRYRVNDARDFDIKTMYRKIDIFNPSVTLLMGKKRNSNHEEIVTVLFDRNIFTEDGARDWWVQNRDRLMFSSSSSFA